MQTIYVPGGRAREYSELALNIYTGCRFGCRYCFNTKMPWYNEYKFRHPAARNGILQATQKAAAKIAGDPREILLCFSCDPYPGRPLDEMTREILLCLESHRLRVQILSKAGMDATRDFDILKRNNWRYGTTISSGPNSSMRWEPWAAEIHDRMRSLEIANHYEISTFVSIEPVIDPEYCLALMSSGMARKIINEWRIGKTNYEPSIEKAIDWKWFLTEAKKILAGKKVLIKKDLLTAAHGGSAPEGRNEKVCKYEAGCEVIRDSECLNCNEGTGDGKTA